MQPPVAIHQPLLSYTTEAKEAKIEGLVLLQAVIRKDGTVSDAKVLRGLGHGLDEAAVNAVVKEWRFKPGTLDGQPVDVRATMEISFRLYEPGPAGREAGKLKDPKTPRLKLGAQ